MLPNSVTGRLILIVSLLYGAVAIADSDVPTASGTSISIARVEASDAPQIDGVLREDVWTRATTIDEFSVVNGSVENMGPASLKSVLRILYTPRGLYVGGEFDQDPTTYVQELSGLDSGGLFRDFATLILDTSGQGQYGFFFTMFLGGSRSDGNLIPERQFQDDWDGVWFGETARTDSGWSVEFLIPWSTLTMPRTDGDRTIGIYFSRHYAHDNERHGWPALHVSHPQFFTRFQPINISDVQPKRQLALFPYAATTVDVTEDVQEERYGADLFWRPSTNFQVTSAVTPDFGTVEADAVVINLTVYEVFFPEKRLFFQEGMEIFQTGGRSSISPLHTRRIGAPPYIPYDRPRDVRWEYSDFRNRPARLDFAAKATGHVGSIRYGVLGATESDSKLYGTRGSERVHLNVSGRDFVVARALYEGTDRGYRSLGFISTGMYHPSGDATSHAIDGSVRNESGRFSLSGQVLSSNVPYGDRGLGGYASIRFDSSSLRSHSVGMSYLDTDLDLGHVGYLFRNDMKGIGYSYQTRNFERKHFRQFGHSASVWSDWNQSGERIGSGVGYGLNMTLRDGRGMWVNANFWPKSLDDRITRGDGSFEVRSRTGASVGVHSDPARLISCNASAGLQNSWVEGYRHTLDAGCNWQPVPRFNGFGFVQKNHVDHWMIYYGNREFSGFENTGYRLSAGFEVFVSAKQYVRFDLSFEAIRGKERKFYELPVDDPKLHPVTDPHPDFSRDWSTALLSMQLRYRWEIAPLSDIYVVYNRRGSLYNELEKGFAEVFADTFGEIYAEALAVKFRYRFGI